MNRTDGPQKTGNPRGRAYQATCGGCSFRWRSWSLCHCGSCHRSFGSDDLFRRHRLADGEHGRCESPGYLMAHRMRLVDGVWRGPEREGEWP